MDLLDFYRGTLSARRVLLLVKRLSSQSFFRRRAFPDQSRIDSWGPLEHLVADLFDLTHVVAASGSEHPKKPEPYPRPSPELFEKERRADARRKALVDKYKARHGGDESNLLEDGGDGA